MLHPFVSTRKKISVIQDGKLAQTGFRDTADAIEWCVLLKVKGTVKIVSEQDVNLGTDW